MNKPKKADPFAKPLPAPGVKIPVVPLSVLKKRAGSLELTPGGLTTLVEYTEHIASQESLRAGKAAASAILGALKRNKALPLLLMEKPTLKAMLDHLAGQILFWGNLTKPKGRR